eukprot:SAG22_NODE_7834_length_703_cov_1.769868_1_plen_147_part_00
MWQGFAPHVANDRRLTQVPLAPAPWQAFHSKRASRSRQESRRPGSRGSVGGGGGGSRPGTAGSMGMGRPGSRGGMSTGGMTSMSMGSAGGNSTFTDANRSERPGTANSSLPSLLMSQLTWENPDVLKASEIERVWRQGASPPPAPF